MKHTQVFAVQKREYTYVHMYVFAHTYAQCSEKCMCESYAQVSSEQLLDDLKSEMPALCMLARLATEGLVLKYVHLHMCVFEDVR